MIKYICDICGAFFDPGRYADLWCINIDWGNEEEDEHAFEIYHQHVCRNCAVQVKAVVEMAIKRIRVDRGHSEEES